MSTLQASSYKTDLKIRALPRPANHTVLVGSWNSAPAQATRKNLYISVTDNTNTLCQGSLHACNVRHEVSVTLTPALCKGTRALLHALQCTGRFPIPWQINVTDSEPQFSLETKLHVCSSVW